MTCRANSSCYAPEDDSILKLDIFCDNPAEVRFCIQDMTAGVNYYTHSRIAGGIWQSVLLESKDFKNEQGLHLQSFKGKIKFTITCGEQYAVNNVMWL